MYAEKSRGQISVLCRAFVCSRPLQGSCIENKKVQSFKWKTFLASFIMTIVMLVGTIGFSAGLTVQTSSTYESYIANGDSAVSQDAAEKILFGCYKC